MNKNNINYETKMDTQQVYKSLNNLNVIDAKRNTMPIRGDNDQTEDSDNQ